ncbi:MAG: helix-turn-helix domain-containing protein, partial [Aquirufa sp.]
LTKEAKELLQKQRFPGNIRQLKNLAEQISVLEVGDRIIDELQLQYYLDFNEPKLGNSVVKSDAFSGPEGMNEREILYKILFDLKRDVTELKKILLKVVESDQSKAYEILHDNMSIFEDVRNIADIPSPSTGLSLPLHTQEETKFEEEPIDSLFEEVISPATDVTLSLEKQEKEIIIRALKKNKNKRKYAAKDLGISERTLYRKIKQYDLEELD